MPPTRTTIDVLEDEKRQVLDPLQRSIFYYSDDPWAAKILHDRLTKDMEGKRNDSSAAASTKTHLPKISASRQRLFQEK
jgi:hypothetical protein